jgi:sporulation protein YlmC with PRC-barrel domain
MLSKYVAAAMIGSALIAAPVMAQSPSTAANAQSASAAGQWQGSKLISMNVYNTQNEKIGTIQDLMVDKNGNIPSVVIGVGGFLGIGERDVAVKFADLKWSNEPVSSSSASNAPGNRPATTGAANTGSSSGPRTYPDHAVLNATRDQLKAMPQFDYNK